MKKYYLFVAIMLAISIGAVGQVGIGDADFLPDDAAMLDIRTGSIDDPRGLLIPRLNATRELNILTKINAIPVPTADGLLYYSTVKKQFMFYNVSLKSFYSLSPWTRTPDFNAIFYNGPVSIGTNTPDLSYKLNIEGGNVNVARRLDVGETATISQDLNVNGITNLDGNVILGNELLDNINVKGTMDVEGNLSAATGVEIPGTENYKYASPKTGYYTLIGGDFEGYHTNVNAARNFGGLIANYDNSNTNAIFFATLHLPDGARLVDIESYVTLSRIPAAPAAMKATIMLKRAPMSSSSVIELGRVEVTDKNIQKNIFPVNTFPVVDNSQYIYYVMIRLPGYQSNLKYIKVRYEIDHVE